MNLWGRLLMELKLGKGYKFTRMGQGWIVSLIKREKLMDMESILNRMELLTQVYGVMAFRMAGERRYGRTVGSIKEILLTE